MRSPSDRKRSARRRGKHERARIKKRHYPWRVAGNVGGAGISYEIYAHGKKLLKIQKWTEKLTHLGGDSSILKSGTIIRRPLYTITVR